MTRSHPLGLDFPWTLALCALAALSTASALGALGAGAEEAARWLSGDAERVRAGEIWRLLSGPLVHATPGHLLRDLAVCLIVGAGYERPLCRRWPLLCLVTLAIPALAITAPGSGWSGYSGLSGMSHGLIAAALLYELRVRRRARWYLHVALALFTGKILYETVTGAPLFEMALGPGVTQAPLAHTAGALAGAAIGGIGHGASLHPRRAAAGGSERAGDESFPRAARGPDL